MNTLPPLSSLLTGLMATLITGSAQAGDVAIVAAEFQQRGGDAWSVQVTLRHQDSGWQHYADGWRVVAADGTVLGKRVLHHPHVNEQPFTRGLGDVEIPTSDQTVYIEAHDSQHGWASTRLEVDLGKADNGRIVVNAR